MKFTEYMALNEASTKNETTLNEGAVDPFDSSVRGTEADRLAGLEKLLNDAKFDNKNGEALVEFESKYGSYEIILTSPRRGFIKAEARDSEGETIKTVSFDSLKSLQGFIKNIRDKYYGRG